MKSMGRVAIIAIAFLAGCVSQPQIIYPIFDWSKASENEYAPFFANGTGSLSGQAFLTQAGGTVVKGAGRSVTLDPATSLGNEWWRRAGVIWARKDETPNSDLFLRARRTVTADADGRFKFTNLPAGDYYVRTSVTWVVGGYVPTQGGLVGQRVTIRDGQGADVVLSTFATQ